MANLVVNQWLQDAVEKACEDYIKAMYKDDSGDRYVTAESSPEYGGISVNVFWYTHGGESDSKTEYLTAQQAFKIFMEQKQE